MSTDPYAALPDDQVLDLFMSGWTSGAATVLASAGLVHTSDSAMVAAQHMGQRVFSDPLVRAEILHQLRRPPIQVVPDKPVPYKTLDIEGRE